MEKYLPIGSIVLLKNGVKRVMIYVRRQIQVGTQTEDNVNNGDKFL